MVEKIDFEDGRISNFQRHVTSTMTLDQATWHNIVHHASTSTYVPNFIQNGETFCGQTDGRSTDGQTSRPALLGGLAEVDLKHRGTARC